MARDDAGSFARGETYANGEAFILDSGNPVNAGGLGGINLQGKEFVFEPNSQDAQTAYPAPGDPCGRQIHCRIVRNTSGVNLKPGRLVHYDVADPNGYEVSVDGYCFQLSDRPAGIVDEYLPPAGVVPNDLFWLVVDGPTLFTQPATPISVAVEGRIVPSATGSSRTDDLAGRVALASYSGATTVLAENIYNAVGFAAAANDTANAQYAGIVHLSGTR